MPEFNIGDCVTYWPARQGLSCVVLGVYTKDGVTRYQLHEAPEGKPLRDHLQVDTTGATILESGAFERDS